MLKGPFNFYLDYVPLLSKRYLSINGLIHLWFGNSFVSAYLCGSRTTCFTFSSLLTIRMVTSLIIFNIHCISTALSFTKPIHTFPNFFLYYICTNAQRQTLLFLTLSILLLLAYRVHSLQLYNFLICVFQVSLRTDKRNHFNQQLVQAECLSLPIMAPDH